MIGPPNEAQFVGRRCFGGLDLASVSDMCAWVLLFQCEEVPDAVDVLARFWIPAAQLERGENRHLYRPWADQGWLQTTPGDAIDYGYVVKQIVEDSQNFRLIELNVDTAFEGRSVGSAIADHGIEVIPMIQTTKEYAAPTTDLERRLKAHQVHHGGNPILRWNVDGAEVTMDAEGRMKPDRKRARERKVKIDGLMALLMANDRLMRQDGPSVYEEEGVFVV